MEREELLKAMEGLTDTQRETITLRFFGGLTSAETGVVMNRNSGAVREMQSSALKRLRAAGAAAQVVDFGGPQPRQENPGENAAGATRAP